MDTPSVNTPPETPLEAPTEASVERLKDDHVAADFANFLAPLIDPAKLDTLKGKRADTPRLRKAYYWLQMAHISGFDAGETIYQAHAQTGPHEPKRAKAPANTKGKQAITSPNREIRRMEKFTISQEF